MNNLLSTYELGKHIESIYGRAERVLTDSDVFSTLRVHFKVNSNRNWEGVFCFSDDEGYHIRYLERGVTKGEIVTQDLFKISYLAIEDDISYAAAIFEAKNRIPNQDFRRLMFAKRLQLFEAIGPEYKEKALREIEDILKKAPYDDSI